MSTDRTLRVLFVDDESRVLDGLRRGMRIYRTRWEMTFAIGGVEALSQLAIEATDIIVTDMRMPGMDGTQLLAEVARAHPQIVRIVLSGQTHVNAARRAVHVAHQFIAKPIGAPELAEAIDRLGNARSLLADVDLRCRASATTVLPASSDLYDEVMHLCSDAGASIGQFAEVIERDPAMTAKLLQLSGSAFFGSRFSRLGMADVVGYLGLDTIRAIAAAGDLATRGLADPSSNMDVTKCQRHSLLVARIARRIVSDRTLADEAYASGLLHDIGKLFTLDRGDDESIHAEAGAYLLAIWGLSNTVVPAVAAHHTVGAGSAASRLSPIAAVVRVADGLAHECMPCCSWTVPLELDPNPLEEGEISGSISTWRAIAAEENASISTLSSASP